MEVRERVFLAVSFFVIGLLVGITMVSTLSCASTAQQTADLSQHNALEYKLANSLYKARCLSPAGVPANLVAQCAGSKSKLSEVYTGLHAFGNELAKCAVIKASCNAEKKAYLQNEEHYTKLMSEIQEALNP